MEPNPTKSFPELDPNAPTHGVPSGGTISYDGPGLTSFAFPDSSFDRYDLREEIARGGMGAVFAAHDKTLDRDVAVKVLLDRYAAGGIVARRFIEEACITGQLQHPGVPSVHDLGKLPDGRPFMAMKLIQGSTLADMLAASRPEPPQLMQIFEKICETVAFAHSKGIIHRDLKPSNVMVGAFGEVQVMDWGLAKYLASNRSESTASHNPPEPEFIHTKDSHTQAGSVLGTPAYMPPEQAQGDIARIDCRADVFALGAILCELLTGQPPYLGNSRDALISAMTGDLVPAVERISGCGADRELIDLAKRCLATDPADRPSDAKVVADTVASHRAGVEERLREAQVEQAATAAKSLERRKRRRVQLAFAASLLAIVLGGSTTWFLVQRDQSARRAEATRSAEVALAKAEQLQAQAKGMETGTVPQAEAAQSIWKQAVAAVEQAESTLEQAKSVMDSKSELPQNVATRAAEISEGAKTADDRVIRAKKEVKFLDDLSAARAQGGLFEPGLGVLPGANPGEPFQRAYAGLGLDIAKGDLAQIGRQLRDMPDGEILTQALLGLRVWAGKERDQALQQRILKVIMTADNDPWRVRLLAAGNQKAKDENAYEPLKVEAKTTRLPSHAYLLLANQLSGTDRWFILLRGHGLYPHDPWINEACGEFAVSFAESPANAKYDMTEWWKKALSHFRAAVAARPDSITNRSRIGECLYRSGEPWEAIAWYRDNLTTFPNAPSLHVGLGYVLWERGHTNEALACYRKAVELEPNDWNLIRLAKALFDSGDEEGAKSFLRNEYRKHPKASRLGYELGSFLTRANDSKGACSVYREMVKNDPDTFSYELLVKSLIDSGDLPGATEAWRAGAARFPTDDEYFSSLGTIWDKANRPAESLECYRKLVEIKPDFINSYSRLANRFIETGDGAAAVAVWKAAAAKHAKEASYFYYLGRMQERVKLIRSAITSYRNAIELEPDHVGYYANLADALVAAGDRAGAEKVWRDGITKNPANPNIHDQRGDFQVKWNDFEGAVESYRRCTEMEPNNLQHYTDLVNATAKVGRPMDGLRIAENALLRASIKRLTGMTEIIKTGTIPDVSDDALFRQALRYDKACCAVLAGTGHGTDAPPPTARPALRKRALDILRTESVTLCTLEELDQTGRNSAQDLLSNFLEDTDDLEKTGRNLSRELLCHWLKDSDLADVRDPKALEKLPIGERQEWQQFWTDVTKRYEELATREVAPRPHTKK